MRSHGLMTTLWLGNITTMNVILKLHNNSGQHTSIPLKILKECATRQIMPVLGELNIEQVVKQMLIFCNAISRNETRYSIETFHEYHALQTYTEYTLQCSLGRV